MSGRKARRLKWLVWCYVLAVVLWLAIGGATLLRDALRLSSGRLVQTPLTFGDFELESIRLLEDEPGRMVSTDPDPQMIYAPQQGFYATRLEFAARALNKAPGEMTLYYTTRTDEGFSDKNKLWARQRGDGSWYFDLGGRWVHRLRLDPDTAGGVLWQVEGIVLNARKPWPAYFVPDAGSVFLLLFAPAFAWAVLSEGIAFFSPVFARRRLAKRNALKPPGAADG
ncbi:MAG: hypothetical protein AB7V55_00165 [Oscillospiraceae bacterium]